MQCDITVTDNGRQSPRTDNTRVIINVVRETPPSWTPTNVYNKTIDEDEAVGYDLETLTAFKTNVQVNLSSVSFSMLLAQHKLLD